MFWSPPTPSTFIIWDRSSTQPGWPSHWVPGICLSTFSPSAGVKGMCWDRTSPTHAFLHGFWWSEGRSSCLLSRHFTSWAISPPCSSLICHLDTIYTLWNPWDTNTLETKHWRRVWPLSTSRTSVIYTPIYPHFSQGGFGQSYPRTSPPLKWTVQLPVDL